MMSLTAIRNRVDEAFADEFLFSAEETAGGGIATFLHRTSGHLFRYIPEGEFEQGFSEAEEKAARALCDPIPATLTEMRPVHRVTVQPFLLAMRPVLIEEIQPDETDYARSAAYLGYDAAREHCAQFGMGLPTESQWEYACRAGSQSLFTWGDSLLSEDELAEWLKFDFSSGCGRLNAFGIAGLFVGEWCSDVFTESYERAPARNAKCHVVRGGGAYFWPWQDEEWAFCMSAMRMPSKDLPDGKCGFRFARNLPE